MLAWVHRGGGLRPWLLCVCVCGAALQRAGVCVFGGDGGIPLHPFTLQVTSEGSLAWSHLGKSSSCWRCPPLTAPQGAAAGRGSAAPQEGKGDLSSPQHTQGRQHSPCGTFRMGPNGGSVLKRQRGQCHACQVSAWFMARRQSPFPGRHRQSCL